MIEDYGWTRERQQEFAPFAARDLHPARIIVQQRGHYRLIAEGGEFVAHLSGRFQHQADDGCHPVAGDFAAVTLRLAEKRATIHELLPRSTVFARKEAGGVARQILAANVEIAFLVAALNADLNPRRLERYLAMAWESGARPVILLTKADLCDDVASAIQEIEAIANHAPIFALSALTGEGLDPIAALIAPGETAVVLGMSGAGKSTLVNALLGEKRMVTQTISAHLDKGRHTTTHREIVRLPNGGLILDTPGMRELGLTDANAGIASAFADIEALAASCRFHDCRHETEPDCAVQAAIVAGTLDPGRWRNFGKLQREAARFEIADDPLARVAQRKTWVHRSKAARARMKIKYENDG